MGRNIATLYFKTERVSEAALAHRDCDQLRLALPELKRYFPVPGTLNYLMMALVFSEIEIEKLFERSLSSFRSEI